MADTRLELQIVADAKAANSALESLISTLGKVREAVKNGFNASGSGQSFAQTAHSINKAMEAADSSVTKFTSRLVAMASQAKSASGQVSNSANGMAQSFCGASSKLELLQAKLAALRDNAAVGITSGKWSDLKIANTALQIQQVEAQIRRLQDAEKGATTSTKTLSERLKELGKAMASTKGHSNNLLFSFIRIAKYRFLRAILREITEGVTTGVKNMYEYAKAVGLSFAPAVDAAKDALFRMKNSIGAALAPLIEMLIPYLMQAVQWFINLINVVNQFLALLNGQTEWTRAITATSDAMDDVKTSAGGAAKAIKEVKGLLADWDELNIIQQEPIDTGSGGGSGKTKKAEIDYTKMFEQVDVFDGKIREVVNWIKDNFNAILDIAKWVGAAILGWNISTALGGIIGTIGSWITTGIIAEITFKAVTKFDEEYIKTGKPGWLLANVLTSAFGAGLAATLVKKFVSVKYAGQAAAIGAAIVLTFSATADVVSAVGNVDVSALSKENLSLATIAAAKVAIATGLVTHAAGVKPAEAGLFSLGALGTLFSIEVGIKAVQGVIEHGSITPETIGADIVSTVSAAAGGFFIAKGAGLSLSKAGAVALAAAGGTISVELGIEAVAGALNAKKLTTESILSALGASGGAGLATLGVLLAAGAKFGVAFAAGGGVAVATGIVLAATIGLALTLPKQDGIKWGDIKLTEEQVKTFAREKMFSADVEAKINLVNTRVEASVQERANVRAQAAELFSALDVLELGINDKASLKEAHTQVKQFIEAVERYAETQTAVLKTGISIIPVINEAGEDVSAEILRNGITGWATVTDYMGDLGRELSRALIDESTGEMKTDWDAELVDTILKKVSNVAKAISQAQAGSQALGTLGSALFDITDLSEDSFNAVIDAYGTYYDQMKESYYAIANEQIASERAREAAFRAMAEAEANTNPTIAAEYNRMADEAKTAADLMLKQMNENLQEALDRDTVYGRSVVQQWLDAQFSEKVEFPSFRLTGLVLDNEELLRTDFKKGIQKIASGITGVRLDVFEKTGITGWDLFSDGLQEEIGSMLVSMFGEELNGMLAEAGIEFNPEWGPKLVDAISAGLGDELEFIQREIAQENGIEFSLSPILEETSADDISEQLDDIVDDTESDYVVEVDTSALETPVVLPAAETSVFTSSVESAVTSVSASMEATAKSTASSVMGQINAVHQALLATINDWYFLTGGVTSSHNTARRDFHFASGSRYHYAYASGGFPETGDYFLARESGPELVGTMGNRTAVANNDQIVAGIASGVASAQQEQNTLLRQQNEYLRRLLAKESTVKVEPSSKWGRFQRQSEAMYARNTGTGG